MITAYLHAGELCMNPGINAFAVTVALCADIRSLKRNSGNLALNFHKDGRLTRDGKERGKKRSESEQLWPRVGRDIPDF